jgi:hypothetical protein
METHVFLCGTVMIGGLGRRRDAWHVHLGDEKIAVLSTASEGIRILEVAARQALQTDRWEWRGFQCGNDKAASLHVGGICVGKAFPWHANVRCWPISAELRPFNDLARAKRLVKDEARRRIAA